MSFSGQIKFIFIGGLGGEWEEGKGAGMCFSCRPNFLYFCAVLGKSSRLISCHPLWCSLPRLRNPGYVIDL